MNIEILLQEAYDIHVHAEPDVQPRAQSLIEVAREACQVGMKGMVIKDHTASTVGRAFVMNRLSSGPTHFFSTLVLNPPVGSLNPVAVEAALLSGVDIVFFPTYGAKNHIDKWGLGKPPTPFPVPDSKFHGVTIFDETNQILPEVSAILQIVARFNAVLGTGHLSPAESLALIQAARSYGIKRILVTHASESVTNMKVEEQIKAMEMGALIEHCFFAVTPSCPGAVPLRVIGEQIRQVGIEHVILSSDFGQVTNGPVVLGFAYYLEKMTDLGFTDEEIRVMISENPKRLLEMSAQ